MFKSPSRNQRSKGIKVKQVLQVFFLLVICFWLIYQVKHSYDKKKTLEETDVNQSAKTVATGDVLKLGRKDPIVKVEKPESNNGKLNEEVEDEDIVNDEDNKNEEAIQEEETGDKDDDGGGQDVVDEIDEHELEKTDEEVDIEEEAIEDEEKGDEEKENKGHDVEDETTEETQERESTIHESREENYKADDASSAVTQTSQVVENLVNNNTSSDLKTTALSTGGREITEISVSLNSTTNNVVEEVTDKFENSSLPSSSGLSEQSNGHNDQLSAQNGTETEGIRTVLKNVTLEEDTTSKDVSAETTNSNQVKDSILGSRNYDSHDSGSENADNVHNDPIDSSDSSTSLEEKNDEKDIEMIANVVLNEDGGNENAAAE